MEKSELDTNFTASGTDSQSLDWEALLSAVGMIKFSHNITRTGSTGTHEADLLD